MRHEDDIIRQLSSIGSKTYMSSHKSPYGDTAKVKTLTEAEYQGLWSRLRRENLDLIEHPEATTTVNKTKKTAFAEQNEEAGESPVQSERIHYKPITEKRKVM